MKRLNILPARLPAFAMYFGIMVLLSMPAAADKLSQYPWYSGAADCAADKAPGIEVYSQGTDTHILRQNKCSHYEAPFMYLLLGQDRGLLLDSGATADSTRFPLKATVLALIDAHLAKIGVARSDYPLILAHSHSHGDHVAADSAFADLPNVRVVAPNLEAVKGFFSLAQWPDGESTLELGQRRLTVIPTPGHQAAAIALYDHQNRWLLTGDSLYPGRLYVRDWFAFRQSIRRLVNFVDKHPVNAVLGAHIEMSRQPGRDYPVGSQHQPDEAPLPLRTVDLRQLHMHLELAGDKPARHTFGRFILYPLPAR